MKPVLSDDALGMIAARFAVLSEPARLRIIYELYDGGLSVNALAERIGGNQPNVSKHLKILQNSGILKREQRGNMVYYSISDRSIFEICDVVCTSLGERLKEQAEMLSTV